MNSAEVMRILDISRFFLSIRTVLAKKKILNGCKEISRDDLRNHLRNVTSANYRFVNGHCHLGDT